MRGKEAREMTLDELSRKGRKLGLTYAQTLSLHIFENILQWVSHSRLRDALWMKEEECQILGRKKKRVPNEIVYYMPDISYQAINDAFIEMMKGKSTDEAIWHMDFYDNELVVDMRMTLGQVPVAFKVRVRPVWHQEQYAEDGSYRTALLPEQEISYRKYPVELDIAECFCHILDKLELIGDMRSYAAIYDILRKQALDGRHVYLSVGNMIEACRISQPRKRWDTVRGYRDYGYMRKRWNRYIKECGDLNRNEDSWEHVVTMMDEFFTPVWNAVERDEVFIGDWMPQLGRYL